MITPGHVPYTPPRDTTMLRRFSLAGVPQYIPFGVDGVGVVVYAPALVVNPLTSVALAAPAGDAEPPLQYASRRLPRRRLQYVRGGSKSRSPRVHLRNATEVDTPFVPNAGGTTTWSADTALLIDVAFVLATAEAYCEADVLRVSTDTFDVIQV